MYSTIRFLNRRKAEADQYLKIRFRNGTIEHIAGPVSMYENPCYHDSISVEAAIDLEENEVIKVSSQIRHQSEGSFDPSDSETCLEEEATEACCQKEKSLQLEDQEKNRKIQIVAGPRRFIPNPEDTIETWHWTKLPKDISNLGSGNQLEKHTLNRLKLNRTKHWIVHVAYGPSAAGRNERTYASLDIPYRLVEIEKLEGRESDPWASLCLALHADSSSWKVPNETTLASDDRIQEFLAVCCKEEESRFSRFYKAANACGIQIGQIQWLRLVPGLASQEAMDAQRRQSLTMDRNRQEKEQALALLKLDQERQQTKMEQDFALQETRLRMEEDLAQALHRRDTEMLERKAQLAELEESLKLESWKKSDAMVLQFLNRLADMGADVTRVICNSKNSSGDVTVDSLQLIEDVLNRSQVLKGKPKSPKMQASKGGNVRK